MFFSFYAYSLSTFFRPLSCTVLDLFWIYSSIRLVMLVCWQESNLRDCSILNRFQTSWLRDLFIDGVFYHWRKIISSDFLWWVLLFSICHFFLNVSLDLAIMAPKANSQSDEKGNNYEKNTDITVPMIYPWLNFPLLIQFSDIAIELNKGFDLAFLVTFVLKYTDWILSHEDCFNTINQTIKTMMMNMIEKIIFIWFQILYLHHDYSLLHKTN